MKEFTVYNRRSGDIDVASVILVDEDTKIIYVGRAYRSPIDQPNRKLGRKIAQGRALKMIDVFNGDQLPEVLVDEIKKRTRTELSPDTVAAALATVPFKEVNYCKCHYSSIQGLPRLITSFAVPIEDSEELLSCREHEVLMAYASKVTPGVDEMPDLFSRFESAAEMVKELRKTADENPELDKEIRERIVPLINILRGLIPDDTGDSGKPGDNE